MPPNLAQPPRCLIGFVVISLSRCCLPNDEGPSPPAQIFFPRTATARTSGDTLSWESGDEFFLS